MRISGTERLLGFLGYLPLFGMIIARWVKRDSIFVQFHARQGAVLFGLWAVLVVILAVLLAVVGPGGLTQVLMAILFIASGLYFLMMLVGMIKVLLGERYRMPVVADVALMLRL